MQTFIKFFSAPTLPDEETNRRTRLLSFILNLHIAVTLGTTVVFVFFLHMPPILPVTAFLSSLPGFGLRALMWRGHVRQASILFVSMVILIMPLTAWFGGYSVAIVTVTVFQCITVLMAGLLLGGWGVAIFVALTGAINGMLIYAELQGMYVTNPTHDPILSWFMQIVAFGAIASMLLITNRLISESFARAQKENDQRRAREQELEQVVQQKTQAEAGLQKIAGRLEILHEIDRALLSASSSREITKKTLARIRQLIASPRASVTLFDFATQQAFFLAADLDEGGLIWDTPITLQEYGEYVIDEIRQNKPFIMNDVLTDPRANELDIRLAKKDGIHAWLYLPLLFQGQLIGALNLGRGIGKHFTAEDAATAQDVANQLAIAVQQTRLYEALQNELVERTQTEEKLFNSEARLRALVENSPDFILEINRQGEILFINRYQEQFIGRNIYDILPPDQLTGAQEIIAKAFDTGQPQATELQTIAPEGQTTWDSIRLGPVRQGELVTSLTVILTDITLKKQTEVALQRSENIYRKAIMSAGAVPYVLDHATHTLTFIGDGILAMTGYSAVEMMNTPKLWNTVVLQSIPTGNLAHLTYEEANRITDEDHSIPWECDFLIRTRDGQLRWIADTSVKSFDEKSEHVLSIGIKQDITERKRTETELRANEERLEILHDIDSALLSARSSEEIASNTLARVRQLIPCLRTSVALFDSGSLNAHFFAIDDNWGNLFSDESITVEERIVATLKQGLPWKTDDRLSDPQVSNYDERLANEAGIRAWLSVPLLYQGQLIGSLNLGRGVGQSFTQQDAEIAQGIANQLAIAIQQAQLNKELQNQLAERERLIGELGVTNAELERFNYTVSHELKSPVVTIKGFLGSITTDLQNGKYERAQKDILRVSNATDKLYDTLSNLLALARIGHTTNPPEEIDLVQLANEALETVHGRIQSRSITIRVSPDLPAVFGDRVRLREVYENLLDNAAKHFGDQPAPLIEVGVRKNESETVVFVKDNGTGIDPKYHQRIFGLFDKLDATSEGTGIGLAIVKRIIETHGGKIWVESEGSGKGSTFCFTIPDSRK